MGRADESGVEWRRVRRNVRRMMICLVIFSKFCFVFLWNLS